MKRKFVEAKTNNVWFDWCRSLIDLYSTNKQFAIGKELYTTSYVGMKRFILAHEFQGTDFLYTALLLDTIMSADKVPGAGLYVPYFLHNNLKETIPTRCSSRKYLEYVLDRCRDEFAKEIFENLWNIAGPLTNIIVKPTEELDAVIRSRCSFNFKLNLDPQFSRMVSSTEGIELINPNVIMIEGAPETIGEINSLLEHNYVSKRPVILVARNFPEEISATLATNWIKNSLSVIPFVYGDSLETINLAADLCTISEGELISPHFGDLITTAVMDRDKWGSVERAVYTSKTLSLYKKLDVSKHIRKLVAKSKEAQTEELREIINDRILSLSNDALEIWVPKENSTSIEELDALVKHYNAFVVSGAVETPIGILPKSFVEAAQTAAQSLKTEILNMGGFLVRVDDEMVAG